MSLSSKRINIGIVGSSFSTGHHHGIKRSQSFEEILQKNCKFECSVYNLSCGGKGTEKYLQSIVQLKKNYNISILLFEVVLNRSSLNLQLSPFYKNNNDISLKEIKKILLETQGYEHFEAHLQYNDGVFSLWQERPFNRDLTWKEHQETYSLSCDLKEIQSWQKVQIEICANDTMRQIQTVIDLCLMVDLCNLLNIKHIGWCHNHYNIPEIQSFHDLKKQLNLIRFDQYSNARQHFESKYPSSNILSDGVHFNHEIDKELIKDWLLPVIESYINK